jgi:FAD/FMN-containing dehydrogenase
VGVTAAGPGLARFAEEVGPPRAVPVVAVGCGTQGEPGGAVAPGTRAVRSPAGILDRSPAEMTVRVGAGTTVAEVDEVLAEVGQCVAVPDVPASTVGGALAGGRSGIRRLGWGPVRDTLLEARFVTADGEVAVAGGPTVKNVSGYDLCRLLVGSLGTLGLLGEVVLRTRPRPAHEQWYVTDRSPWEVRRELFRPTALLWDGATSWALLDGHPDDVRTQASTAGLTACPEPPPLPPHRWSVPSGELRQLADDGRGRFVAQVGVGVVHREVPQPPRPLAPGVVALHQRLKGELDPTGRLAPGRSVGRR